MHQHTSLAVWLDAARAILLDSGFDADDILTKLGVDTAELIKHESDRYGIKEIGDVWREIAKLTNDPAIGLNSVDKYFQPASWQALGLSVLCSSSLRDAFERIVRYGQIITDATSFSTEEFEDGLELQIFIRANPDIVGDEATDFGVGALMSLFRMAYPGDLYPIKVEMPRAAIEIELHREFYGCDVVFESDKLCLRFATQDVDRRLPMSNTELAEFQDKLSEDYAKRFGDDSLAIKVKDKMLILMPAGEPTPQSVASALLLSVRNLQRKLNKEGTSFSKLLTEIRQGLAVDYLKQPYRSCNEIAYLLGFSDHSNFTRAFRRWHGQTPSDYRKNELGQ